MSGYNYNQFDGPGIPDMGNNGLPLVLTDANLPTQAVSQSPVQRSTDLVYSPYVVESNLKTPAPVKNFKPTPQPVQPKLWKTVLQSVLSGGIKTGTNYAATGDYSSQGASVQGGGFVETPRGGGRSTVGTGGTPPPSQTV